ncbi:MAG: hypothetical protein AUJ74_03655 [Candidatus Omnitrophica bacterium CG1_02_44_16]|nr:MAG: hypothetical protein AUJ74_03655 [Candidatus Omnitrophica bacterium CG1_02_44_16]PIY82617.1 MAG: hypothetical protein COY78_05820 [Candidatus Omnitrophica bacterium CG_4_10_14_0_8_um_filter_44_12]PIZ84572.1 MAG: hypothetical protein COX96_03160 [Candidatus Omnitrophica bacterium CG_4_10_14_0_2_um_filter_44_9]
MGFKKEEDMIVKNRWLVLILCLGTLLFSTGVRAEDSEESKVVKAADGIIKTLPDECKAGLDFSKMPPAQRIDFVLTVDSKIQKLIAKKFQDVIKARLMEYAKEAIRANAFMEIGAPQIRNAYLLGKAIDWAKINAQITSSVDTNMAALSAGLKTAQISWGAIKAYQEGDFNAAAAYVGKEISTILAKAYIPGYGYVKMGAAMVEFLGNYVLDYATDTAVDGMLNSMYGKKSDPQRLAQWLVNRSPQDIMEDLDGKWNDGEAFGYLFKGQGTDKGDEAMKSRVQQALISMRGDMLAKKKEQEQKEKQADQEIENNLQKYRSSKDALQATAEMVQEAAYTELGPIREFKKKVNALRKEDIQEDLATAQKAMDDVGPDGEGDGVSYVPLNYGSLISELEGVYSEVKEVPGGGYDQAAMERMYSAYNKRKDESIKGCQQANEDNCQTARKLVNDQFMPALTSLTNKLQGMNLGPERDAVSAQINELNAQYQAVMAKRQIACQENNRKIGVEMGIFAQEESIVRLEAQERADKFGITIEEGAQKIAEGIRAAQRERDEANKAMIDEVQEKFSFPSLYPVNTIAKVETCSGVCGPAEAIKKGELELYAPGSLHTGREEALLNIEKLKHDMSLVPLYIAKEKAILQKYQTQILNLRHQFETLVPENLRSTPGGGNEDYLKQEDERVKSYGAGSASLETWSWAINAPFVSSPGGSLPEVEPALYFDKQIADLDVLGQQRVKHFQEGLQNVQEMISTIDYYADLDRIAVSIISLAGNLDRVLAPCLAGFAHFNYKDGKYDQTVAPQDSDGAKVLAQVKSVWEQYKPKVERLRNNVKAYGKGLKYLSSDSGPERAIARLAQFEAIPGRIEAMEKSMAQAQAERDVTQKGSDEGFARLRADFKTLQDPAKAMFYLQTLRSLRMTFEQVFKYMTEGSMRDAHKDEYIKLRDEVEAYAKKHDEDAKKASEAYKRQQEQEAATARENANQEAEQKNNEVLKKTNPAEFYGYKILNPRFNSYSVEGVVSEIVVTKDKLAAGQIQLTGRMANMDNVKTMLISENGGRTWIELPRSADISYSFTPIPNKSYNFMLQIKTEDFLQANLMFVPGSMGLIYKDEDFSQQIVAAVKALAEAYERQDIGSFSRMISRNYLGNKTFLEEGVRFDFDMFVDIKLVIYINRIEQRGDMFVVETKWDKAQTPRKTGQAQKTIGQTQMMFILEDNQLKIQNLRGNLLYATLSTEIAQASGLSSTVVNEIRIAHDDRNPTQPGAGTIEDSGGVSSSSVLTARNSGVVAMPAFPGSGYDFSATAEVLFSNPASDTTFEVNLFQDTQVQQIIDGSTFSTLTTAPTSGYGANAAVFVGGLYTLKTGEGYYVKIEILSANVGVDVSFKYAIQTDGTTNIRT